jgi:acyl carrier protein
LNSHVQIQLSEIHIIKYELRRASPNTVRQKLLLLANEFLSHNLVMKLFKLLKEAFSVSENEATDEKVIMNFEAWDSMSHMHFIANLESEYAIEFTGNEIAQMTTVGDVKKAIQEKGVQL